MGKLRLQLLGAFRLQSVSGEPMLLPTKKSKALLAYLALAGGQRRSRSLLASLLWDEAGEPQARESLRQTLSLLRKTLLPSHSQPIISEGDAIALDPSVLYVDALEFAQFADATEPDAHAHAANLFSGELLEGFDLHAPEFDRWLSAVRQGYHEKAVDLLSRLLAHYIASGNLERAASVATRLLTLDPLRESSHRALMELYSKQGRYAAALRQYQVCLDVLARELNVEPEPGTTALYREIRAQRNAPREQASEIARSRPETVDFGDVAPRAARPLERRQITILTCEIAGLSALSAELEPEELVDVATQCRRQCATVVERFGGHIERFSGDRFTALFGFPKANEHSAEQAVRAGLALTAEVRGPQTVTSGRVAARVGIATSPVVAGKFSEDKAEAALALIGEAPRIANLLQTVAPRNAVLIARRTKNLVKDLFECAAISEPVFASSAESDAFWRVLAETRSATRFIALHRPDRSPFTGREAELEDLLDRWRKAQRGEGHIVFITGEPGIGKSRLTLELQKQIASRPHAELFYQCSPFHADSALYPFIRELERAADFHHASDTGEKLDKLAALLSGYAPAAQDIAPLFTQLLSIPSEGRYPQLTLSPAQQRRKTLSALLDRVESFARRDPALVVFEDAHWADASSLEVLDLLVDRIRTLPVLLLVTSRPGFEPAWGGLEHVRPVTLDKMIDRHARALIQHLSPRRNLPIRIVDQIVAKTDGIPLFLEELTQTVLEFAAAGVFPSNAPDFAIPATLHDSLMARLDRLGEAKATAQIAAVIGREFSEELLRAVAGPSAARLDDDLGQLASSGLIFEQASISGHSFIFKHGLVRDVAYQSLLKGRRQQIHGAIASAIRETFPAVEQNHPELVARHLTEAGAALPALGYWIKAGMLAISRSAYREAVAHLEHGLELVPALSSEADKQLWERRLLAVMGPAVMALKGYAATKGQHVFERASELIDADCPAEEKLRILCGLWNLRFHRGELATALPLAEQILKLARETGLGIDLANCLMGQNLSAMGEFEAAHSHLREVIDCFRAGRRNPPVMFGVDESILALVYMTRVLWASGYPDQAAACADEAMTLARNGANSVSVAVAFVGLMFMAVQRPQSNSTEALIEEAVVHADEHGLALFQNWFAFFAAAIRLRQGRAAEALPQMHAAIAAADGRLSRQFRPFQLGCVAEAHLRLGDAEKAFEAIDNAIEIGETTGEKQSEVGLHRLRGEILLALQRPVEATREFQRALSIARRQKAKSEELRVALSMVKSKSEAIDADRARATLARVYATFDEGMHLPEMSEARAALGRIGES
jgi:DNA-binding SARP family transcriptional activator/predicted negative regulator of RcsB-dependent stress response